MPTTAPRRLPQRQKRDHLEWLHTARFLEEVHRLEADGRVASRQELEQRLLLPPGGVAVLRAGKVRVPTSAIELLKREYNGDFQFILLGVRDPDTSGPVRGGRSLRVREGYAYPYQTPGADLRARAGLPPLEVEKETAAPAGGGGSAPTSAQLPANGTQRKRQALLPGSPEYAFLLRDIAAIVQQAVRAESGERR